jgi:hypothetical protein
MDHTCQGFLPLRGSQERPLNTGFPRPATFRPQTFSVSRRFTPLLALQAYFIPQPRPGFSCPGVSSLRAALLSLIESSCPLAVRTCSLVHRDGPPFPGPSTSRLYSARRSSAPTQSRHSIPSSGFVLLQVLPPPAASPVTQPDPLMTLAARAFKLTHSTRLQRLANRRPGSSLSSLPTCPRF